jgi:hypothetical protein
MSLPLPAVLNEDTLPVLLARIGTPLKGDGQLNLMAGMPLRPADVVSEATVTTAHVTAGFSTADTAAVVAVLHKVKATKA